MHTHVSSNSILKVIHGYDKTKHIHTNTHTTNVRVDMLTRYGMRFGLLQMLLENKSCLKHECS